MNRIFWVLLIVCAGIFGTAWYIHKEKTRAINSGVVYVRNQTADKSETPLAAAPDQSVQSDASSTSNPTGMQPSTPATAQRPSSGANHDAVGMPPASDTVPRNPPNGMIFAGTGKYQLYRQGDITWRLDTDSGDACILFATDALWRKQQVYRHGCGAA
jgi:hypothetical protein